MTGLAPAAFLGSAGPLALVRCGWCGRRNCFDLRRWAWFEVMFCRRCWQAVLFEGLTMITRWEGERLLMENLAFGGELRALREVERVARSFLVYYDSQPYWLWAPQTRRTAADLRRAFSLVEAARARGGGAVTEAGPAERPEPAPVEPAAGAVSTDGEVYELTAAESLALDYFSSLAGERRAEALSQLERLSRLSASERGGQGEAPAPAPPGAMAEAGEGGGRA